MKLTKKELKQIIRKTINEHNGVYPRPQHPMIANANSDMRNRRIDIIADAICNMTGESADLCDRVAEDIVAQLEEEGLC